MADTDTNAPAETTSPEMPFRDTFDLTKDDLVLSHLWEILKSRFAEEKSRQEGARDRAAKLIGFSFSTLAFTAAVFVLTRDTVRELRVAAPHSARVLIGVMILLLLAVVISFATSLVLSLRALASSEYRTWNEVDLKRVELGGKDQEYGYWRFLLKAGWAQITHSNIVNTRKVRQSDQALYAFLFSAAASVCFVFYIGLMALWMPPVDKKVDPIPLTVNTVCLPPTIEKGIKK